MFVHRRSPAYLLLGAAGIIAGCGGGGSQNPAAVGNYVPPAGKTPAMSSAKLTVTIPARGSASVRRKPQWISPTSTTLGVRVVPVPAPAPTPTEQVFTLPSPGPAPTATTLTVAAPAGTDTFIATAYDGSANALATGQTNATITLSATNNLSLTMLGVASGVVFTVNGSSTPAAWRVLTNLGANQTASVSAAPVDADNNLIPGNLAAPAPVNGTGGVQLSAPTITTATTLTATYPQGTNAQGTITAPLALNAGPSPLNVAVNADSYIFALNNDNTLQVIDVLTHAQVGSTLAGVGSSQMAAVSGCNTGAFAVDGNGTTADVVTVPAPTVANPTPPPAIAAFAPALVTANPIWYGVTGDNACNLYYNVNTGGYPLAKFSGFDSVVTAIPAFGTGMNISGWLYFTAGQVGVGNFQNGSSSVNSLYVPSSTGGAAVSSASFSVSPDSVNVGGVAHSALAVYLVTDLCTGQPNLQNASGGPSITLSEFAAGGGCCSPTAAVQGAAQANDGTMYVVGLNTSLVNVMAYAPVATIGNAATPTVALGGPPYDVQVTSDQQFVCVLEPAGSGGQIEIFKRLPAPSLVATVPLSSTANPNSFSIGP